MDDEAREFESKEITMIALKYSVSPSHMQIVWRIAALFYRGRHEAQHQRHSVPHQRRLESARCSMSSKAPSRLIDASSLTRAKSVVQVEQGSKNHELVPTPLIQQIAGLRGGSGVHKCISALAKVGLIAKVKNAKCMSDFASS